MSDNESDGGLCTFAQDGRHHKTKSIAFWVDQAIANVLVGIDRASQSQALPSSLHLHCRMISPYNAVQVSDCNEELMTIDTEQIAMRLKIGVQITNSKGFSTRACFASRVTRRCQSLYTFSTIESPARSELFEIYSITSHKIGPSDATHQNSGKSHAYQAW